MRLRGLQDSIQGTVEDAGRIIGGARRITSYIVTAMLDFIGNLHIMIPVLVLYVGVGFFGTLKMRVATLLGAIVAFWLSTSSGIVQGSIIGLLVIVALLLLNKIDPRLLTRIQELLAIRLPFRHLALWQTSVCVYKRRNPVTQRVSR